MEIFYDTLQTDTIIFGGPPFGGSSAYYYIDDICVSTDSVYAANWTNITNIPVESKIRIYPNPVETEIIIRNIPINENALISIFDALGKKQKEILIHETEYRIDASNYSAGIYIIQISIADKSITQKLIIK